MALSFFVSHIEPDICRKSRNLYTPPVFSAIVGGETVGISERCFSVGKSRMMDYHMLKTVWWYVKPSRYNTEVWQTDGRTDWWLDRISILIPRVDIAVLTRDNKKNRAVGNKSPSSPASACWPLWAQRFRTRTLVTSPATRCGIGIEPSGCSGAAASLSARIQCNFATHNQTFNLRKSKHVFHQTVNEASIDRKNTVSKFHNKPAIHFIS